MKSIVTDGPRLHVPTQAITLPTVTIMGDYRRRDEEDDDDDQERSRRRRKRRDDEEEDDYDDRRRRRDGEKKKASALFAHHSIDFLLAVRARVTFALPRRQSRGRGPLAPCWRALRAC